MTEAMPVVPDAATTGIGQGHHDTGTYWPPLNYADWRDIAATIHLWTQIVGKVRLAFSPWLNHGWHVPLYVDVRGLGTSVIHAGRRVFEIDVDLFGQRLVIRTSDADDPVKGARRARNPHRAAGEHVSIHARPVKGARLDQIGDGTAKGLFQSTRAL